MPIILSGDTILYTPISDDSRWTQTGVIEDTSFGICDEINVLKQIQFAVNPATTGQGTLTLLCDISGDQTINLTSMSGSGNSFTTMQPDFGTSPVADSATDTLTLTSSDSILAITGDSATDTLDFKAGSALSSFLNASSIFMFANVASDIGGYFSAPSISLFTAGALGTTSQTVTTTPTILEEFATASGGAGITVIPIGLASCHYETQKTSGSNNYYTYFTLYKRDAGGTETLLLTSDNSSQSSVNSIIQNTVTAFVSPAITLLSTDRLVVKVYAVMVSSSATITVRFDSTTNSRVQTPSIGGVTYTGDLPIVVTGSVISAPLVSDLMWIGSVSNVATAAAPHASSGDIHTVSFDSVDIIYTVSSVSGRVLDAGFTENTIALRDSSGGGFLSYLELNTALGAYTGFANPTIFASTATNYGFYLTGITAAANFSFSLLSASRTYTLQNLSGTIAFLSDVAAYVPLAGGTMTGALINDGSTDYTNLILKSNATQTTQMMQIKNSGGTVVGGFGEGQFATLFLGDTSDISTSTLYVKNRVPDERNLTLVPVAAQTANIFEVQNTSNVCQVCVSSDFRVGINATAPVALSSLYIASHSKDHTIIRARLFASQTELAFTLEDSSVATVWSVTKDGRTRSQAGTASSVAYGFYSSGTIDDTNGMYRSAANEISFSTNSTQRLSISSSGAAVFTGTLSASNLSGTNTGDATQFGKVYNFTNGFYYP